ncbi:MAG TPA: DNA double-strand break repair nuclease NurA [Tissierellales bacterium]|nr:DNA double-strand break repair nuclease NurA [Tissierellales bacterium]
MLEINKELKDKFTDLNINLAKKYENLTCLDKKTLRKFIENNIGKIIKLEKMSFEELKEYPKKGGIVGVDGSVNKKGGAYPHYIEVFQGLAKNTIYPESPIYKADFYTPLVLEENGKTILEKEDKEKSQGDAMRNYKLASIEIEAALESIETFDPYVIIMDGSLIRYDIECFDKWIELRKKCEEKGIIIIGVIEDIKTSILGEQLMAEEIIREESFYDRELLYGLLNFGEMIIIKEEVTKKSKEGFSSMFMRSSNAPNVIGMDILDSQKEHLKEMARLVFSLTPRDGRGVPLWLDVVDNEVKISDKLMDQLLEEYLDREIYELLFISERDKRPL